MDLGLKGRRALVTGSSKGLGRACAETLCAEGATVFIAARSEPELRTAAQAIGAEGWMAVDLSSPDGAARLIQHAVNQLGGLDVLVVNTGGPSRGTLATLEPHAWNQAYETVLMSAVRLCREAQSHLQRSKNGRIVILTSTTTRAPVPELTLSSVFRTGVTALAKVLSTELAPNGVTVNTIATGRFLTDALLEHEADSASRSGIELDAQLRLSGKAIPSGRFGKPDELAALCAFLCSEQAAYITGQTIAIDGGHLRGL